MSPYSCSKNIYSLSLIRQNSSVYSSVRQVRNRSFCNRTGSNQGKGDDVKLEDIVFEGFGGVLCVESGGPMPGVGCAGRGIFSAFQKLEELNAFEVF